MTPREWFTLALRVPGAWRAVAGLAGLAWASASMVEIARTSPQLLGSVSAFYMYAPVFLSLLLPAILLRHAPGFAARVIRQPAAQEAAVAVHEPPRLEAYRFALRLLGVYAVLLAVKPAANAAVAYVYLDALDAGCRRATRQVAAAATYVVVAAVLLLRAPRARRRRGRGRSRRRAGAPQDGGRRRRLTRALREA